MPDNKTLLGYAYTTTHPGTILKEELQARGIAQKKFADIIGVSQSVLNEILNGKRPVNSTFALLVEAALGIKAYILVGLQTECDLQTAQNDKTVELRIAQIRNICATLL